MSAMGTERIVSGEKTLAYVVRNDFRPGATVFVTPGDLAQQLGFIVYPAGASIPRHRHLPVQRTITGTTEVVMVRQGSCEAEIFDDGNQLVATVTLYPGDVIVLAAGGHGFRMQEDTVLMEVKQGPFAGVQDKERLP